MALNVPGLVATIVFYLMVLGIGIWASFKSKRDESRTQAVHTDMVLLGDRKISLVVGIFTTTATWVGGTFIIGTAETVYDPKLGLIWAVMPLAATVAFTLGGLFFAEPMRKRKYVTMMDPFQVKYGDALSGVLSVVPLLSEVIWVTSTLISLGVTMSVILDLSYAVCIWISAAVAVSYTLLGGLYSVAYTDIIQLLLIFITSWVCVPFLLMSPTSVDITTTSFNHTYQAPWVGSLTADRAWMWIDIFLLLSVGDLGFQDFHQRTLSASSSSTARLRCYSAAILIPTFGIPPALIGAVAASTDWNQTSYGSPSPSERGQAGLILPLAMQHLTPSYISFLGIGAVAAAVMSSTDSALLSAASIFSTNIYKRNLRTQASENEMRLVIRIAVVFFGLAGTSLTFLHNGVMAFWVLGGEIAYILMFPQLVCVLFFNVSNGYGASVGLLLGALFRLLCGEPLLGIPPVIRFPGCIVEDGVSVQYSPIRTICMLLSFATILLVSYVTRLLAAKGLIPARCHMLPVTCRTELSPSSNDNNLQPLCSNHSNLQPLCSNHSNLQPLCSNDINLQPLCSNDINLQPLCSNDINLQPLCSNDINLQPLCSNDNNLQPLCSNDSNLQPLCSNDNNLQPLCSNDSNLQPLCSNDNNLQPLCSNDINLQPLCSNHSNLQPLCSNDNNLQPLCSNHSNLQPLCSNK